jgi:hypothetical protein
MDGTQGKLDVRAEMAEPTAVNTKRKVEMNSARYERSDGGEKQCFKWTRRLFDAMAQLLRCFKCMLRARTFRTVCDPEFYSEAAREWARP